MPELFLDTNAHLPMSKAAMDAFIKTNASLAGHGHALSPSKPGRAAEAAIEEARYKISEMIGASHSNQVVFTSTCTEACEWGLSIFSDINKDKVIYSSPTEHPAVSQAAKKVFSKRHLLQVNECGVIDVSYPVPENSGTVSIYVQNEIGIIQPIHRLKSNSLFIDMSQAPGKVSLPEISKLSNVDVAVYGAHKFGGPSSVGFFYLKDTANWKAKGTGSRYFFDRAGTPDVCSIVATEAALRDAIETFPQRIYNMIVFRDTVEQFLEEHGFEIIGKKEDRSAGTTFARLPKGKYAQIILQSLSEKGIYIGLGSACGSVHSGLSPLMKILGQSSDIKDFIRVSSFGQYNKRDAEYFCKMLKRTL